MGKCLPPWYNSPERVVNFLLFFFSVLHLEPFITPLLQMCLFKPEAGEIALYLAASDTAELLWAFAYKPITAVIKITVP